MCLGGGSFDTVILFCILVFFISLIELISGSLEDISIIIMVGNILIILRVWLLILIFIINYNPGRIKIFFSLLLFINLILVLCFKVQSLLGYYFFFECVLIPIYMLILGWGYQPERLVAATIIFFYTLFASLPLLVVILYLGDSWGTLRFLVIKMRNFYFWGLGELFLLAAFLVKFPIYGIHLWLPKAHVEAPVSGSIILAGVLLKLGGYGVIIVRLFGVGGEVSNFFMLLGLLGGGLVGAIILVLVDIKVAIAYSSVVHIAPVIAGLLGPSSIGLLGAVLIILAHGLTSSGIFGAAFILYIRSHRRRLISNKGIVGLIPCFSIIWFLLIVLNFAGPFTLNLFREVFLIGGIVRVSIIIIIYIRILCFFSAAYNLNLFASSQQGRNLSSVSIILGLSVRELFSLVLHITPCVIILLAIIF